MDRARRRRLAARTGPRTGDSDADAGPHPRAGRARRRRSRRHRPQGRGHGPGQRRSGHRDTVAGAPHVHGPDADAGPRASCSSCRFRPARHTWDRWRASAPTSPTRHSAAPRRGWPPASVAFPPAARWSYATAGPSPPSPPATRVEGRGPADARERRAAGVWWTPAVFCTTREAIEPWRFDVADATALQLGGARLRRDRGAVHIAATATSSGAGHRSRRARPDAAGARRAQALRAGRWPDPPPAARRSRCRIEPGVPADRGRLRACADRGAVAGRRVRRSGAGSAADDVAAFSPGRSLGIVWTSVTPAKDDRLRIATPLHRLSFGSPLVSGDRVVGLVASPTTAWPAALVAAAASRAPRLAAHARARDGRRLGAGRVLALR